MIYYATNNPATGYEFMLSGEELPERFDLTKYTHVWVYDPSSFNDDAPNWTRFPMDLIHTPITTTEGAQAFLRHMADTGRSFHPDDDPSTIVNVSTGEPTFTPDEWEPLRDRIGEVFSYMDDPYTYIMDLEGIA